MSVRGGAFVNSEGLLICFRAAVLSDKSGLNLVGLTRGISEDVGTSLFARQGALEDSDVVILNVNERGGRPAILTRITVVNGVSVSTNKAERVDIETGFVSIGALLAENDRAPCVSTADTEGLLRRLITAVLSVKSGLDLIRAARSVDKGVVTLTTACQGTLIDERSVDVSIKKRL